MWVGSRVSRAVPTGRVSKICMLIDYLILTHSSYIFVWLFVLTNDCKERWIDLIWLQVNMGTGLFGQFSCFCSVQLLSRVWLFATPWIAARQASLSITNSWSPPKPMSTVSVMPSNHLVLCRPLLLPSIFPSIRVFSNESALHIRWPKYWSFSFNISPSNEHSGLISFRMDWLDLLAVQGTLKSLLQHHSSKASVIQCSAFFIVQLSHPYMTTGKTIALTRWTFVGKVMSLFFNGHNFSSKEQASFSCLLFIVFVIPYLRVST